MRKPSFALLVLAAVLVVGIAGFMPPSSLMAQSELEKIGKMIERNTDNNSSLSTDKIISGLKEALRVGTKRAVAAVGRPDGFLKNETIKIMLPPKFRKVEPVMRLAGMGQQVDDLEVGMNRAAEKASPAAEKIFVDALMKMTISDARGILSGDETAATEYFKRTCSDELKVVFTPVVHEAMVKVGVTQKYEELMQNPIADRVSEKEKFNLDDYIVQKTLDGLFYMLGQEEKKIRTEPMARTTELLREVFGKHE